MPVCELLNALPAPAYLERVALGDAKHNLAVRRAIRTAIRNQVEGRGFSLVEVLSPCPTGWKKEPQDAARFVLETMTRTFPLGRFREPRPGDAAGTGRREPVPTRRIPSILGVDHPPVAEKGRFGGNGWSMASVDQRFRNPRIKVAGFGGQGVLFLGTLIAGAGMRAGFGVSWLPSYGPEMRGGTAHCHVILSEGEVDSPLVTRAGVLFALNKPSIERFAAEVEDGGLVVYDSCLIAEPPKLPGRELIAVPATSIAERLGSARVANVVALGAYLGRTGALPQDAIGATLRGHGLQSSTIDLNLKALEEGMRHRP